MSSTGQDVEVPSTSQLVSYYGMVSSKDQIRAKNDQDQMSTNVPNETDPVLDSLPINSEELEEERSQSPDCIHTTSTAGNTEQIRAENDQDQMTTNVPNKTDPVLDSLPITSEELEEERSQSPDCIHTTSTAGNTEQIRAENDQDQMTTNVSNETDPVLDSLPITSEELEEEMFQSPDCTHTTSTAGNTEKIRAENDQDQMTTNVPNKTDPVLDSLPITSEELEEERSQSPDCIHTTSTAGNTEQIRAENDQDEMTTNVSNETDPVLDSLPITSEELKEEMSQRPYCTPTTSTAGNTEQCQKHHLMCTTVSSLEKCTQCFGPCSSFKWVGYQCKGKIFY
ncbi:uncharacterized protein LOC122841405 [Gambusia affinis]|uniref:uncharacterized protein LOC122841405 n=1 Tax=Gambusia affinis TaxID=33528 RepID=UPI001CDD37BA|nr:uncharacterized protein LOC122841405 [Gambusia affinis]